MNSRAADGACALMRARQVVRSRGVNLTLDELEPNEEFLNSFPKVRSMNYGMLLALRAMPWRARTAGKKVDRASAAERYSLFGAVAANPYDYGSIVNLQKFIKGAMGTRLGSVKGVAPHKIYGFGGFSLVVETEIPIIGEGDATLSPFLLKFATEDSFASALSMENESAVGMLALNALRAEIPNFMYIYHSFDANVPKIDINNICEKEIRIFGLKHAQTLHTLIEKIPNAVSLNKWHGANEDEIMSIFAQVVLALGVARERYDFSHNDLHGENVLVTKLATPHTLRYRRLGGMVLYLETQYIAHIIDFGLSHAKIDITAKDAVAVAAAQTTARASEPLHLIERCTFDEDSYVLNTGSFVPDLKTDPHSSNSLRDITRLLFTLRNTAALAPWRRLLFGGKEPEKRAFARIEEICTPEGITIDPFEFFLAALPEARASLRIAIDRLPDDFAPLLIAPAESESSNYTRCIEKAIKRET